MRLKIEICLDNAAFEHQPAEEVSRILGTVRDMSCQFGDYRTLRDSNGNTVGKAEVVED